MSSTTSSVGRFAAPKLKFALLAVAVCTAAVMTAYETTKELLLPGITVWQSHAITIAFTSVLSVVTAYVVASRLAHLNRVMQALIERRNAHIVRIQEAQAHNAAILRSSLDCIISMDEQGRITEFNPAAEKTFGLKREEVLGKPAADTILPPSLRSAHSAGLARFLSTGDAGMLGHRFETIGWRSNRFEFPVELAVVRVDLPGPPKFTAFLRDITEYKSLEQQLIRAQKMESIGRLAGGVAHDFNNLLTIIIGYASRLREQVGSVDELAREVMGIRRAADRAASLTSQLLAFGRRQILHPTVLNLNSIVEETRTMLARIMPAQIEIVAIADPAAGWVSADRGQIEQVIVNLAMNARDAMPKGGRLTLESASVFLDETYTHQHVAVQPGEYVMLAVSDTGTGMDAATQERIFEPFFTTKEIGKGTGLGLSCVYGIVKQSGGHIWVYSEVGRGTTFKIYLPRVSSPDQQDTKPKPELIRHTGDETILLVEDNRELRDLAESVLKEHGYTVLAAATPGAAERLSSEYKGIIHLLLTDVIMPEMSGVELAQRLKQERKEIKVSYMSGYTDSMVMPRGESDKEAMFLQKPFTPAVLTAKMREALDGEKKRAQGSAM